MQGFSLEGRLTVWEKISVISHKLNTAAPHWNYRIYPAIRQVFSPLEWLQITKLVLRNLAIIPILPFLNNPKDLDLSYKMDLDLSDCFGREKTLSYNRRNTVPRGVLWRSFTYFRVKAANYSNFIKIPSLWALSIQSSLASFLLSDY